MKTGTKVIILSSVLAFTLVAAQGQGHLVSKDSELWGEIYDPPNRNPAEIPKGSELRKALFNQLRPRISAMVKGKAVLFNGSLKAYRNWAFFSGETVDGNGAPVSIGELGNSDTVGLWIRTQEGWRLVDYSGGHSDVFYEIWPEQYGVSRALLGFE